MNYCLRTILKPHYIPCCQSKSKVISVFHHLYATQVNQIFEDGKPNAAPKDSRRLYVFGLAEHGALGHTTKVGNERRRQVPKQCFRYPTRLHFGHYYQIKDIACGYGFTLVATKHKDPNLKLFGCGINSDSQIGYHDIRKKGTPLELIMSLVRIPVPFKHTNTQITRLAAGRAHTIVLTDQEGAFTFGNNSFGQCGRGIVDGEEYHKKWYCHRIEELEGEQIVDVVCGQDHTLFLTASGRVYSSGWGADGQTGLGHYNNQDTPSRVKGDIQGENIVRLSCAVDCVLAVNDKGEVFGWGNTEYGQISERELQISEPRALSQCAGKGRIVDVAAGGSACAMLNEEGSVYSWGYGMLGQGPKVSRNLTPTLIPSTLFGQHQFNPDSRVKSLTAGTSAFGAVTNQGALYMWGKNNFAQLGLGNQTDQYFPLKVSVGADVHKVSCGVDHTVVLSRHFVT
uniref:Williams-Beuren syndrome chromosomal region 16 protein homolog n=1 Tax=Cacopsylla melanoneura TaxID=428564 RepID=A0A8D8PSU3_9HEMI